MNIDKMLRIADIFQYSDLKGGFMAAFSELDQTSKQELIEYSMFDGKSNMSLLFEKYNHRMNQFLKLVKKEKTDKKTEKERKQKTDYELITEYVFYMGKINTNISNITLADAYVLLKMHALEKARERLLSISLDKVGNMARKANIKHTDMTNIKEVNRLISQFNG